MQINRRWFDPLDSTCVRRLALRFVSMASPPEYCPPFFGWPPCLHSARRGVVPR